MKRFLISMAALAIITANSFAQVQSDIQSATLIHGDQTSVYYKADALVQACAAATDGDVIVLSAGFFNGISTNKSLTIYGRGYTTDTESGAPPTSVNISIYSKESYDELGNQTYIYPTVLLEGLSGGFSVASDSHGAVIRNLVVRKCKGSFTMQASNQDCLISQCIFTSFVATSSGHTAKQLNIENSWLSYIEGNYDITSTITFDHCILKPNLHSNTIAHYTNCIIYQSLPTYSTSSNNIFVSSTGSTESTDSNGNWYGVSNALVWDDANEDGSYGDTKTYALKFPLKYIGTDGTQVGVNGGNAPFDRISPIPRILSSDIDIRTSEEGKLNVSLKVEAQTKE